MILRPALANKPFMCYTAVINLQKQRGQSKERRWHALFMAKLWRVPEKGRRRCTAGSARQSLRQKDRADFLLVSVSPKSWTWLLFLLRTVLKGAEVLVFAGAAAGEKEGKCEDGTGNGCDEQGGAEGQ